MEKLKLDKPFIEIEGKNFTMSAFDINVIEGYETPENFPYCCPFHRKISEVLTAWFEKFPNCCEPHKEMQKEWWFKKSNYEKLPNKILKQLSFTEHHILKRIDIPEWEKDITDYIQYNVNSFGHPAVGLDKYLGCLTNSLQRSPKMKLPYEKKQKLIEFIHRYSAPQKSEPQTSLDILYDTYRKWLNIFPFEISYFSKLKKHFESTFPFLNGKPEHNQYSGTYSIQVFTQTQLIEVLTDTTKQLLKKIDSIELRNKGLIPDTQKHSIELINESHRIKQASLLGEFTKGEIKYVNVLNKWLANEKDYFKEIISVLRPLSDGKTEPTKSERLREQINRYGFFELEKVKVLASDKKEKLIELIGKNKLPYQIAMFDFLGFLSHLAKQHFPSKFKLNKEISKWLGSDKEGRGVKANISTLGKKTNEDKQRYTAHRHKEEVQNDYQALK